VQERQDYEYGRFAWIMDPDGRKLELWEPPRDRDGPEKPAFP
jgi:predicted enzyme related to lactoylglutathione lyase